MTTILLVLLGYASLAVALEGPVQVWLLVLAPLALVMLALVIHIAEYSKSNPRSRSRTPTYPLGRSSSRAPRAAR